MATQSGPKQTLSKKRCVACEGGIPKLNPVFIRAFMKHVPGWKVVKKKEERLSRDFKFSDFKRTLAFVNKVGAVAEREGHHPNISFTWGRCTIEIYTHSVGGLTENDFILAAKINELSLH